MLIDKRSSGGTARGRHGISVRNANLAMAAMALMLSLLLINPTCQASSDYQGVRTLTDHYARDGEHQGRPRQQRKNRRRDV